MSSIDKELEEIASILDCCSRCGSNVAHACTGILSSNSELAKLQSLLTKASTNRAIKELGLMITKKVKGTQYVKVEDLRIRQSEVRKSLK